MSTDPRAPTGSRTRARLVNKKKCLLTFPPVYDTLTTS